MDDIDSILAEMASQPILAATAKVVTDLEPGDIIEVKMMKPGDQYQKVYTVQVIRIEQLNGAVEIVHAGGITICTAADIFRLGDPSTTIDQLIPVMPTKSKTARSARGRTIE